MDTDDTQRMRITHCACNNSVHLLYPNASFLHGVLTCLPTHLFVHVCYVNFSFSPTFIVSVNRKTFLCFSFVLFAKLLFMMLVKCLDFCSLSQLLIQQSYWRKLYTDVSRAIWFLRIFIFLLFRILRFV